MPDLASRNEVSTSPALLPMLETMPNPVITARRMSSQILRFWLLAADNRRQLYQSSAGWNRPTRKSFAV